MVQVKISTQLTGLRTSDKAKRERYAWPVGKICKVGISGSFLVVFWYSDAVYLWYIYGICLVDLCYARIS